MKTSPPVTPATPVWVDLATFDLVTDARHFKGLLVEEGFPAQLHDERKLQRYWFAAKPKAGIHVAVHEQDLEPIRRRIAEQPAVRAAYQRAILCPECQSSRVQYPQMTRKNVLPTILAKFLVAIGAMEHKCYCEDCHFTWPYSAAKSRQKPAGAPKVPRTVH
jgi:hypothetical protein